MKTICVFNPEHDICLANGDKNFVPPMSALRFAREGAPLMQLLYGKDAVAVAASEFHTVPLDGPYRIIPWGWDAVVKQQLFKQGAAESALLSDAEIDTLRNLQHRTSVLSLQDGAEAIDAIPALHDYLGRYHRIVLKAPWSGSGRGVRWVTDCFSQQDLYWAEKVIKEQRCVIAEPRRNVVMDFAMEYVANMSDVQFVGYSFFKTQSGVYRYNMLWNDDRIQQEVVSHLADVSLWNALQERLNRWLQQQVLGKYQGPLGVDFFIDADGKVYLGEVNFRHTMGLVAHEYLRLHPSAEGTTFSPSSLG